GRATAYRALLPVLRADCGAAVALALAGGRRDPRRTARRRELAHRKTGRRDVSGRSPLRGPRSPVGTPIGRRARSAGAPHAAGGLPASPAHLRGADRPRGPRR